MHGGCSARWISDASGFVQPSQVIPLEHERHFKHARRAQEVAQEEILNGESRQWRPKEIDGRLLHP